MKWAFDQTHCFCLEHSAYDLLASVLESTYAALQQGLVTMNPSELVDFNTLCDQAGVTLPVLTPTLLPALRRIK